MIPEKMDDGWRYLQKWPLIGRHIELDWTWLRDGGEFLPSLSLIGSWITFSFLPRSAIIRNQRPDVIEPTNRKLIRPKYTTDSQVGQVKGPVAGHRNRLSDSHPWPFISPRTLTTYFWSVLTLMLFWRIRYKILLKMTLFAAAAERVTGFRRSFEGKLSSNQAVKRETFSFFSAGRYQLKVWWRERTGFVIRTITGSPVREFAENDCLGLEINNLDMTLPTQTVLYLTHDTV